MIGDGGALACSSTPRSAASTKSDVTGSEKEVASTSKSDSTPAMGFRGVTKVALGTNSRRPARGWNEKVHTQLWNHSMQA